MDIKILFDKDRILASIHLKPYSILNFSGPIETLLSSDLIVYLTDNPAKNHSRILKHRHPFLDNINNFYATVNANAKEQLAERS